MAGCDPADMLWLAPRVPPGKDFDLAFVPLADTIMFDTYHPEGARCTGQTGDWKVFEWHRTKFKKVNWVLAGGPESREHRCGRGSDGARIVDVNSGIESAPGVKDHARLQAFAAALRDIPAPASP